MINNNSFSYLKALIFEKKSFCITFHTSPDLDAICSGLALKKILLKKEKEVFIISPSKISDFLKNFIPKDEIIIIANEDEELSKNIFINSDAIIFLDLSQKKRLDSVIENFFNQIESQKIVIDHHKNPDLSMGDVWIHDEEASSTCEIIYDIICRLDFFSLIDKEIAEYIYTGIISDTGFFSHSNVTSSLFIKVSKLIDLGISSSLISSKIKSSNNFLWIRFLGFLLSEKLNLYLDDKIAFVEIKEEEMRKYNIDYENIGDIVFYMLSIKSVEVAILAKEKGDDYKLSFRSKGNFDVANFSRKFFDGGGHFCAAGGIYMGEKKDVRKNILELLKKELKNTIL